MNEAITSTDVLIVGPDTRVELGAITKGARLLEGDEKRLLQFPHIRHIYPIDIGVGPE